MLQLEQLENRCLLSVTVPLDLEFDTIWVGTTATSNVSVTNNGPGLIEIDALTIETPGTTSVFSQ